MIIAGIDEVGRGPLVGPVVCACVHIPNPDDLSWLADVTDSKKLSKTKREAFDLLIREHCVFSIVEVSVQEIDNINIFQATMRGMERAAEQLSVQPDFLQIDGNKIPPNLTCDAEAIVKGDTKIKEIACASIIAKVHRDKVMERLGQQFPEYDWHKNAGYGTVHHLQAIKDFGVTEHHRQSFAPVKNAIPRAA